MTDYIQAHTAQWQQYFRDHGYPCVEPLAAGVEGAVYKLQDGLIAKVWGRRKVSELVQIREFYATVAAANPGFDTPEIRLVQEINGIAVTYDKELRGRSLQSQLSIDDQAIPDEAATILAVALRGLAAVPATEDMRKLAVLDEPRPFWQGFHHFRQALIGLLTRRLSAHGSLLRQHIFEFDRKCAAVRSGLLALDDVPCTVIHGDLFPENILVRDGGEISVVLDFGFLTTAGDPRLDAAITAVITNMYGPHSHAIAQRLTTFLCQELGYDLEVLLLYRAVYALVTSNCFSPDGSDGHFAWCVQWLNHPLVTEVLLS